LKHNIPSVSPNPYSIPLGNAIPSFVHKNPVTRLDNVQIAIIFTAEGKIYPNHHHPTEIDPSLFI